MAYAAEPSRALPVTHVLIVRRALYLLRAFGDDDDAELRVARVALANLPRDRLHREGNLGDEYHVSAARDARVERYPARVPPHHFENHHAVVRLGRRVQAV